MSVTAFPVLARILADRGVQTSRLGVTALVIMAIVTTMATTPILDVLTGRAERDVAGGAVASFLTPGTGEP
jgi:hypothetical protein